MNWNANHSNIATRYLDICYRAANDMSVFNKFKCNEYYTPILEHATKDMGNDYINSINQLMPELLTINRFFDNDNYGNPNTYDFIFKKCSPTTLGYIHVLANLLHMHGTLDNFKIVEIGGGYGGQAKIINDYCMIQSYDIIDLPQVTELQNKYIEVANIANTQTYNCNNYPTNNLYDLVISDYALTEVTDPLQSEYIKNIVLNCTHGWIACNGPITMINELESKFSVTRLPLPLHSKLGKNFSKNSCYLIW